MKSETYEQILEGFETAKISRLTQTIGYFKVLIGEIQRLDKDPTEEQVKGVLKKLIKGCRETIDKLDAETNSYIVPEMLEELSFYEGFAPTKMSEDDLRLLVAMIKASGASLGDTMKQLKADHEGQYDGAVASRLYKEI